MLTFTIRKTSDCEWLVCDTLFYWFPSTSLFQTFHPPYYIRIYT